MDVPLFVERRGSGSRLFILPGGPGFSYTYLLRSLGPLENNHELIYVDYPGCGRSKYDAVATATDTVQMISLTIDALSGGSSVDFLCHSFGTYVLGEMAKRMPHLVNKCVFVNPTPHSSAGHKLAEQNLISRLTQDDLQFFQRMSTEKDLSHSLLWERLLPYYCGRNTNLPEVTFDFSAETYFSVSATLGEFDSRQEVNAIKDKLYIFGTTDFILPAFFDLATSTRVFELNGGHFVFEDDHAAFIGAVRDFLGP
jgi:pimeloyl-ACP methyl ester carboxylesterase